MSPILSIIIFLPLLGGIVVLLIPKERVQVIRWTAVGFAALGLLLALILILLYAQANITSTSQVIGSAPNGTFLFNEQVSWIPAIGINYSVGVDGISLFLVALTALLTLVCIAASFSIELKVKNLYGLHAAAGLRHTGRVFVHESVPVLYFLGSDADPRLFPGRRLGR